jgi:hypothetical protein
VHVWPRHGDAKRRSRVAYSLKNGTPKRNNQAKEKKRFSDISQSKNLLTSPDTFVHTYRGRSLRLWSKPRSRAISPYARSQRTQESREFEFSSYQGIYSYNGYRRGQDGLELLDTGEKKIIRLHRNAYQQKMKNPPCGHHHRINKHLQRRKVQRWAHKTLGQRNRRSNGVARRIGVQGAELATLRPGAEAFLEVVA